MDLADVLPWVAFYGALCIATVGTVAISAQLVARTLPSRVLSKLNELDERLTGIERDQIKLRRDWAGTIEDLDAFERSIDRKRKQISAGVSRLKQAEAQMGGDDEEGQPQPNGAFDLAALRRSIYGKQA